jgi:hypothetical protein
MIEAACDLLAYRIPPLVSIRGRLSPRVARYSPEALPNFPGPV